MSITSIDVGGISCQYFAVGAGEPIVLLHCTGHSGRQWAELAAALRTDFEVIAPDLCGYGGTAHWPGSGTFNLGVEADLVDALVEKHAGFSVLREIERPEGETRIGETKIVQPAIAAIQIALARLLIHYGLEPDGVVGHSIGEVAAAHIAGSLTLVAAGGDSVPLLLLGVVLFGAGFGNATSLPPLIAQVEFVNEDVPRVVGLIVGISQGGYAFAPALFGLIRELAPHAADAASGSAPHLFLAAALVQGLAIAAFLAGRQC